MNAVADRLRPLALVGALVGIVAALHALGHGPLAGPPTGSVDEAIAWASEGDPIVVALALFRLLALAVAAHLALTTALGAVGHLVRRPELVRAADAWTMPMFRGALRRAAGLGLSAAAALSAPVPGAQATAPNAHAETGTATMRAVPSTVVVLAPTDTEGGGIATMRLIPPTTGESTVTLVERDDPPPAPPTSPVDASRRHVVRPGDHLWQLSADAVAESLGRPPTDAEVAGHWRRVVAANPHLVDPDLLHPGDEVTIPRP